MLLALFLAGLSTLTPMRWNSGDPKTLEVLAGSPVNCILIERANCNARLVKAAEARGIAVMVVVHPADDFREVARLAAASRVRGIVLEGEYETPVADRLRAALASAIRVVELPSRGRMLLDAGGDADRDRIVGTWQGLWPGIEIEHGGTVSTGPTSAPWINTNTGFLRFARAATGGAIWVAEKPPAHTAFAASRYALAISDAEIAGARWVVALDDDLQGRLLARDANALYEWRRIAAYLTFFDQHSDWREYRPYSRFAVIQDAASGGLLSSGILDMLSVQHTAARPLPSSRLNAASLADTQVILNVDQPRKEGDWGRAVVNPPAGWRFPAAAPDQTAPTRKEMDLIQPLWEATYYASARKNFGVRTFNTASVIFHLLKKPGSSSLLLHLLNYADYPSEDVTVQVLGKWHRARLYRPESGVTELPVYPVKEGTGIDISRIDVLATLRLD